MEKNKTKSSLRIIFSAVALIAFVLFSLCDNLMVNEYTSYHTYGWRLGVLNDLFLVVPFIALLVFSIMERKLKYISGRVYVVGIFVLYLIQTLMMFFEVGTSDFSIFCCTFLGRSSDIVTAILIVRIVMLMLIPIAHKIILKIYSLGMISFFSFALVDILTTDIFYIRSSVQEIIVTLAIDALFHIGLYFFSELMDKDNKSTLWLYFLDTLMYPIFGSLFDDEDDSEELDDFYDDEIKDTHSYTDYAVEYKKIQVCILDENDEKFIPVNTFLENLSQDVLYDGPETFYSKEKYVEHLTALLAKIKEINTRRPGFISEEFAELINALLIEKDEDAFRLDVVTVAKLLFNQRASAWMAAVNQYFEYDCNTSEEDI